MLVHARHCLGVFSLTSGSMGGMYVCCIGGFWKYKSWQLDTRSIPSRSFVNQFLTMLTKAFAAAVLPTLALGALIPKRENGGDFYSDLSLRTVGARNTLVSRSLT